MKLFEIIMLSITLTSFCGVSCMETETGKCPPLFYKNDQLLFGGVATAKIKNYCQKPSKKIDIEEELQRPIFFKGEEKVLGCLKYCATFIKNNRHHISHVAAALPFWYQGYQGVKSLYDTKNLLNSIDPNCKLDYNDPVYPIFTELLKASGKTETEVPIFRINYHHLFGVNAGAANDTWIYIWKVFDSYSSEEQRHLLAHELTHIKYKDGYTGTLARIVAPLASYCAIKGSAKLTSLVIDKILTRIPQEEINKHWHYRLLKKTKNCINDISEIPFLHYGLSLYLLSQFYQYQETRADIEGALLAGTVKGGLSWLCNEALGNYHRPEQPDLFTLFKLAPLEIINYLLGYREHPSYGTRMKNLIMFARQTGLPGAEGYLITNNNTITKIS